MTEQRAEFVEALRRLCQQYGVTLTAEAFGYEDPTAELHANGEAIATSDYSSSASFPDEQDEARARGEPEPVYWRNGATEETGIWHSHTADCPEGCGLPRVKFLQNTVHPDHGEVKKGEVLVVDRAYVRDYEELGIAHETDDDVTKRNATKSGG